MRRLLGSLPGWFAFQVVEYAVLFALVKILMALGVTGGVAFAVAISLAVVLVVVNYQLRRRYLPDDEG